MTGYQKREREKGRRRREQGDSCWSLHASLFDPPATERGNYKKGTGVGRRRRKNENAGADRVNFDILIV